MANRSKGITWFVVISFAITWGSVLGIYLLRTSLPDPSEALPNPLLGLLSILGTFGPAIAAIVVRKWITREGFKDAGLHLNLRAGWKYYLCALLYPLVVIPVAWGMAAAAGVAISGLSAQSLATVVPLFGISMVWTLIYFGEEFGWRGYLQDRVAPGKPLPAALLTGLIWGIWHYAFVISGISLSGNPAALLIYPINCALISIFYGWMRTKSKSVWPVCLAHAVGNMVVTNVVAMLLPDVLELLAWGVFRLAGYAVVALVLVLSRQVIWREAPAEQPMVQD
jgi:membrane protease YdiL (CAAX protease family)